MKFFDKAAGRDVCKGFPGVVRFRVTFPFDQILEAIVDAAGISDLFDFKELMIIFDIKGRGSRSKAVRGDRCGFGGIQE